MAPREAATTINQNIYHYPLGSVLTVGHSRALRGLAQQRFWSAR